MSFMPTTSLVKDSNEIVSVCSKTADFAGRTYISSGETGLLMTFYLSDATLLVKKETNILQVVGETSDRTSEHE